MKSEHSLGALDYIVMITSLLISSAIGIVFKYTGGKKKTMDEYFLAGKSASKFPVIMSISATTMSSVLFLGGPAEVYRYGPLYCLLSLSTCLGMLISSCVFIPVYFQCNISSIYEFLEMRFGKFTKYTVSYIFILQMTMYASCVLYGPALVMNYASNISVEFAIFLCGGICTFYCFMGGLKAVLWTDVFQTLLMFTCLFILHITGISEIGFPELYRRAVDGGRLNFIDFSLNLSERYTMWNTLARGLCLGLGFFGTSQIQVQRYLSMSDCKRSQSALRWSSLSVGALLFLASSVGIMLYSVLYLCDPVLNSSETGVTKYDQLVPYFIITRLQTIPGLVGLCIAGIFSASLSTISSAINSLSMVTVVDFIQPFLSTCLTEKTLLLIGKILGLIYGAIFILLTFAISKVDSIVNVTMVSVGVAEGPILAIFLIGVLSRKGSDKIIVLSLLLGFIITGWIGLGTVFYSGRLHSPLPLVTSGCLEANASMIITNSTNSTCFELHGYTPVGLEESIVTEVYFLYKISSFWIGLVGCFITAGIAFILILLTGWKRNTILADSKCLSTIIRF